MGPDAHPVSLKVRCNAQGKLDYPPYWHVCFQVAGTLRWFILSVFMATNSLIHFSGTQQFVCRLFQIRWAALTPSLMWSAWPYLKLWTLDLKQVCQILAYIFLAKCGLLMTCPSGVAQHSPHHAVLERGGIKEDFLLGKLLRLSLVTPKMDKQCHSISKYAPRIFCLWELGLISVQGGI